MTQDRQMTQAELAVALPEAQIGALQAYALFMEGLVAAMLVARLSDSRAVAIQRKAAEQPELVDGAMIEKALAFAMERNEAVRDLFERGAPLRLLCAKIGALPLDKPMVDIPDPPASPAGLH